jgi:hypothetical protein
MSYSDLNSNYFFNKDGGRDKFSEICPACITLNISFILKNRANAEFDPFSIFLEDVTPLLILKPYLNQLYIVNLLPYKPKFLDEITYNTTVHKSDPNVVPFLENLLDQGQLIICQTIFQMLPYSIFYNLDYKYETDKNFSINEHHVMLLLWHDKEFFYFVDNPALLNPSNCEYINRDVLKIKKTEIAPAFFKYTKSTTIAVNKNAFENNQPNDAILKGLVKNYYLQNNCDNNGELRFYGLDAFRKLIDICDHQEEYSNYKFEYGFLERDLFRLIISRKEVFHQWLLRYSSSNVLCDSSRAVIDSWNIAKSAYTKNILRKHKFPRIEASYKQCLEKMLDKEENFINNVKEYLIRTT